MTNKPGEKIIHVKFKSGPDHYFGSMAAIYELFSARVVGISQQALYDYDITPDKPYENKICTISTGKIKRKKGGRKRPTVEENDI